MVIVEGRRPSNFIPRRICTCGRRGRRPSNRSRDNYTICPNPRRSFLEGRRPRRLVATRDINHIEIFAPVIIIRSAQTRDDRSWRAGGLAGLSQPATSITSKYSHPQPGGAPASVPVTSTRHISRMKHLYPWAPRPVPLQLNAQQSYLEGRRAVSPETSRGGASQALHGL
jgi:hypothetical protein